MELILRLSFAAIVGMVFALLYYGIYKIIKRRILKHVPEETRIDTLRKYSEYEKDKVKVKHSPKMVLNRPAPDILRKYNYSEYFKADADSDEIVFSMLNFVCDNFRHGSNANIKGRHSLTGVIKSCEKTDMKTNCRGLSLMLAELLRMNGVRARHVCCKPYEEPFSDCHVVVDCLLPSGARIMFDPTYRLYLTDDNGEYVSLAQLREGIIAGRTFRHNADVSYNGEDFDYGDYIEYMTKNALRFNTNYNLNDTDSPFSEIELIPKGYTTDGYSKVVQYTTDPDYFWDLG